jgi:hypothetical protein
MTQRQTLNALFSAGLGKQGRMGAWAVAIVGAVRNEC